MSANILLHQSTVWVSWTWYNILALFVVLYCRGLTVHQAARFSQLQKLQVARLDLQTSDDMSDVDVTAGTEVPIDSHPISVSAG